MSDKETKKALEKAKAYEKAFDDAEKALQASLEWKIDDALGIAKNAARDLLEATDAYKAYEAARDAYFEGVENSFTNINTIDEGMEAFEVFKKSDEYKPKKDVWPAVEQSPEWRVFNAVDRAKDEAWNILRKSDVWKAYEAAREAVDKGL